MANIDHLKILVQGSQIWNQWRTENRVQSGVDLSGAYLGGLNLRGANLSGANLSDVYLDGADLFAADLGHANLSRASLVGADLTHAIFYDTNLRDANLSGALMLHTIFGDVDLSIVKGIESVRHEGPSNIGVDTIYRSRGEIPKSFLRDAGVPEEFLTYIHSLVGKALEFYSCFISYSHKDEEFARRLYSRMRDEHLRVWFAPEHIKGGEKLHEQIDRAIQIHDRLLLVLSENSMQSEWVITAIRNARRIALEEKRRKLFPIRLTDFEAIRGWKCFDAEAGKDLAIEVREYFIPDFSNWKDHDSFEAAFARLQSDLKAQESI